MNVVRDTPRDQSSLHDPVIFNATLVYRYYSIKSNFLYFLFFIFYCNDNNELRSYNTFVIYVFLIYMFTCLIT